MSYCRWSSDNWKCDLYCYESDEGYVTHVAGRHVVGDPPPAPFTMMLADHPFAMEEWREAYKKQRRWFETAPYADHVLPHAGESFVDKTLECFLVGLCWLRDLGYRFGDYVIEEVIGEINGEYVSYELRTTNDG